MKFLFIAFTFIFSVHHLHALSVTPNPAVLGIGTTTVTFTFDCSFTGSVLIPTTPSGVTISTPNIKSVSNGQLSFPITVTSGAPQNFSLNFVVISSDMTGTCAPINSSAAASFSLVMTPANNDCSGATVLQISTNSCTAINYTTTNATSSGTFPNCAAPGFADLYYTFNANNDTVTMEIPVPPGTFGYYGLFDNCPNAGGNQIACSLIITSQNTSILLTGLTVGQDYFLQILFLSSNTGIDQEICLHSTTTPPPNNNCLTNIVISDMGPNLPNISYQSSQTISTSGLTTVMTSGVVFDAGTEVILNPGFETGLNVMFEAVIGGCTP